MATERKHLQTLIDKIEDLPPEWVAEVEDFVDFIRQRKADNQLTWAAMAVSEPVLKRLWDNPDDAEYDKL